MKTKKILSLVLAVLLLLGTMSVTAFAGGGGTPAILGETYTGTIHGTLSEDEQSGNIKEIVSSNPDCIKIISITTGKDIEDKDIVTVVYKAIKITDETVTIDYKKFNQESGDWGTFSIMTYLDVIAPSDYLDLESSTTTILDNKTIDQNYTFTQSGDTTYTDVTKVKLTWTVSAIAATYTSTKKWNPNDMKWEETKTVGTPTDGGASFTLTNLSSVKVNASASFKAESGFTPETVTIGGTAITADSNSVYTGSAVTIGTVVKDDKTVDTSIDHDETIEAVITPGDNDFASAADSGKYGTYTVTLSAAPKQDQTAPSAPTKASVTPTTVTLTAVSAGQGNTKYGYNTTNIAPTTWQNDVKFTGLEADTTYYFFAKYEGSNNYNEAVSVGTEIATGITYTMKNKTTVLSSTELLDTQSSAVSYSGGTAYNGYISVTSGAQWSDATGFVAALNDAKFAPEGMTWGGSSGGTGTGYWRLLNVTNTNKVDGTNWLGASNNASAFGSVVALWSSQDATTAAYAMMLPSGNIYTKSKTDGPNTRGFVVIWTQN